MVRVDNLTNHSIQRLILWIRVLLFIFQHNSPYGFRAISYFELLPFLFGVKQEGAILSIVKFESNEKKKIFAKLKRLRILDHNLPDRVQELNENGRLFLVVELTVVDSWSFSELVSEHQPVFFD